MIPFPPPKGYPYSLASPLEIAEHIEDTSSGYVDIEFVESYFEQRGAVLTWLPMNEIRPGPEDANIPSARKEAAYLKRRAETSPPIVIENGIISDGHHRYRASLKNNVPGMWAYVVVDENMVDELLEQSNVHTVPPAPVKRRPPHA